MATRPWLKCQYTDDLLMYVVRAVIIWQFSWSSYQTLHNLTMLPRRTSKKIIAIDTALAPSNGRTSDAWRHFSQSPTRYLINTIKVYILDDQFLHLWNCFYWVNLNFKGMNVQCMETFFESPTRYLVNTIKDRH